MKNLNLSEIRNEYSSEIKSIIKDVKSILPIFNLCIGEIKQKFRFNNINSINEIFLAKKASVKEFDKILQMYKIVLNKFQKSNIIKYIYDFVLSDNFSMINDVPINCSICNKPKKIKSKLVQYSGFTHCLFCDNDSHDSIFSETIFIRKLYIFIINTLNILRSSIQDYKNISILFNNIQPIRFERDWIEEFGDLNYKQHKLFQNIYMINESMKFNVFLFTKSHIWIDANIGPNDFNFKDISNIQKNRKEFITLLTYLKQELNIKKDINSIVDKYKSIFIINNDKKNWIQFHRNMIAHNNLNYMYIGIKEDSLIKSFINISDYIILSMFDNLIFFIIITEIFLV